MRLLFIDKSAGKSTPENISLELNKSEISSVSIENKSLKSSVIISVEGRKHAFNKLFFNPQRFIQFIKS